MVQALRHLPFSHAVLSIRISRKKIDGPSTCTNTHHRKVNDYFCLGFFCIHFSRTAKNEEEQQSSTWIQEKSLLTLDLFQWNSLNLEFWLLSRPTSWNSSPFNSMHFRHFYLSGISENRYSTKEFRHRKIKVIRAWMFAKKRDSHPCTKQKCSRFNTLKTRT